MWTPGPHFLFLQKSVFLSWSSIAFLLRQQTHMRSTVGMCFAFSEEILWNFKIGALILTSVYDLLFCAFLSKFWTLGCGRIISVELCYLPHPDLISSPYITYKQSDNYLNMNLRIAFIFLFFKTRGEGWELFSFPPLLRLQVYFVVCHVALWDAGWWACDPIARFLGEVENPTGALGVAPYPPLPLVSWGIWVGGA